MVKLTRRWVVVAGLMFWQGGFTFYAAVVVPIGTDVLGSALQQGLITQRVTNYLNLAGIAALTALAWDVGVSTDAVRRRRLARWLVWGMLAVALGGLFWLHGRLDALIDECHIIDRESFYAMHQVYLLLSTAQWAAALLELAFCLWTWQAEDAVAKEMQSKT